MNLTQQQKRIAKILICYAQKNKKVTYKELGKNPAVNMHYRHIGQEIGAISKKCISLGLPPLSVIVVNASTQKPGNGYPTVFAPDTPPYGVDRAMELVFSQKDWSKLLQCIYENAEATDFEIERAIEGLPSKKQVRYRTRNTELRNTVKKKSNGTCAICGFNAKEKYGEQFENKIHIHHLKPLSLYNGVMTSLEDLIAVCPICHMILHSKGNGDVFSPDEVRAFLKDPNS